MLVLAKPERPVESGNSKRATQSDNLRSRPGGLPGVPNLRSRRLGSVWSAHTLSARPPIVAVETQRESRTPVGGVPVRAEQQRHVMMLLGIADDEDHGHDRIER